MSLILEVQRRAGHLLGPLAGIALLVYFAFHIIQGERGIIAFAQVQVEIKQATAAKARAEEVRRAWENRVERLRPESIDPDLLEERVRAVLGLVRDDEVVILRPSGENAQWFQFVARP